MAEYVEQDGERVIILKSLDSGVTWIPDETGGGSGGGGGGHTIEDEGTPLTARDNLNFVGDGVTVTDSAPDTVVTIPGGAASALDDLSDVTITGGATGHVLIRDATDYKNRLLVEADISDLGSYSATGHTHLEADVTDLTHWGEADHDALDHTGLTGIPANVDDLGDVANTTPADKHVLVYDGVTDNRYENRLLVEADISDLGSYSATGHTHSETDITDLDHWTEIDHDALDHTGLTGIISGVDVVSNVATARLLGRTTAGSGDSEELTAAQAKTLLAIVEADITDLDHDHPDTDHDHDSLTGFVAAEHFTEASIDHGNIDATSLTHDDHTQYALLAGRSGGQSLIGGTASGDDLVLTSTSHATKGEIQLDDFISLWDTAKTYATPSVTIMKAPAISHSLTAPVTTKYFGLNSGEVNAKALVVQSIFDSTNGFDPFAAGFLFSASGKITTAAAHASLPEIGPFIVLNDGMTIESRAAGLVQSGQYSIYSNPLWQVDDYAGSDRVTVQSYRGLSMAGRIGEGATVDERCGVYVGDFSSVHANGTITDDCGIRVVGSDDPTGTTLSLWSEHTDYQMRHAGSAVFGVSAAPQNSSTGLELRSTTKAFLLPRMTTTQRNALTAVNGMVIYNTTTTVVEAYENGAWVNL